MPDKAWKQLERRLAADLGGKRIPVTGIDRHGSDIAHPLFAVQVKLRKCLPAWIFDWLSGICGSARPEQVGILVLKTPRMKDADALVVLRWKDWVSLHGVDGEASGEKR